MTGLQRRQSGSGSVSRNYWPYTFIVLGVLVSLAIVLLFSYQLLQRRRQEDIFRRELARLADPEAHAANVHQTTRSRRSRPKIPRETLDKIPQYIYYPEPSYPPKAAEATDTATPEVEMTPMSPSTCEKDPKSSLSAADEPKEDPDRDENNNNESGLRFSFHLKKPEVAASKTATTDEEPEDDEERLRRRRQTLISTQTTCVICLDEFAGGLSIIRELPCNHIFHSKCIDTFLTRSSSLCPLCKRDVLVMLQEGAKGREQSGTR